MTQARPLGGPRGLSVASLEIGRVLADRDCLTFRAQGTCMYPTIQQGDVLRLRSCAASQVRVGEIAVCRTPEYLFSHRVIATGERDGRPFVVTRSDRSPGEGDGPTFDEDLLGVVVSATRAGKPVPLQPTRYAWPGRTWYAARLALIETTARLRWWQVQHLAPLEGNVLQRTLARAWFKLARPRMTFVVRVPLNATLGDDVFRRIDPAEFDPASKWHDRPIERWMLVAHLDGAAEPAAWATFVRDAKESWRVAESHVRRRYRGAGLDAALAERARGVLGRGVS